MTSLWRQADLPELVATLVARPGHEAVRTLAADILRNGLGAAYAALDHEVRLPEVRGRADMLFGATVFEFKSDLRRELGDVLARLPDYLAERERQTRRRYLGIATDGASFVAFELRNGTLIENARLDVDANDPGALLTWLDSALADRDDLLPDPLVFRGALGRGSPTFGGARTSLEQLWGALREHPEVAVKRELWDGLLREAYGAPVGEDSLFLQHTYLTIVAKTTCRPQTRTRSSRDRRSPRRASMAPWRAISSTGCCLIRRGGISSCASRGTSCASVCAMSRRMSSRGSTRA